MLNLPPFGSTKSLLRVLIKGIALAILFNIAFLAAGVDPVRQLVQVNLWGLQGGRARLVYPSDLANGQLHTEAQLATHQIRYQQKADDEFRVAILGESGIAGWGLNDDGTVSAQLTARQIEVDGKQVAAYNLAYPQPGVARDVVLLDAVLDLPQPPDLVIWFVTAAAFDNSDDILGANRVFFNINEARLRALVADNPELDPWFEEKSGALLDEPEALEGVFAVTHQDLLPVWLNSLLYPFLTPELAQTDARVGLRDVPENARYGSDHPGFGTVPNETWAFLGVGCRITLEAGRDLLVVNRPILVGEEGEFSNENYNSLYSRTLYDDYRDAIETYTVNRNIAYVDTWDLIPPENYTDTPLHADAEGYGILAAELETILSEEGNWQSKCAD